jgi:hypothetical protein
VHYCPADSLSVPNPISTIGRHSFAPADSSIARQPGSIGRKSRMRRGRSSRMRRPMPRAGAEPADCRLRPAAHRLFLRNLRFPLQRQQETVPLTKGDRCVKPEAEGRCERSGGWPMQTQRGVAEANAAGGVAGLAPRAAARACPPPPGVPRHRFAQGVLHRFLRDLRFPFVRGTVRVCAWVDVCACSGEAWRQTGDAGGHHRVCIAGIESRGGGHHGVPVRYLLFPIPCSGGHHAGG